MWWFFYESNSWLEDSRSSVWSGDLPKTTIYTMFDPMGISRPHFKKMNDLQHRKNSVISSFCQHWRKSPDEMRKSIIISEKGEKCSFRKDFNPLFFSVEPKRFFHVPGRVGRSRSQFNQQKCAMQVSVLYRLWFASFDVRSFSYYVHYVVHESVCSSGPFFNAAK